MQVTEQHAYDVPSSRLSPPPSTVRVRSGGEYSQAGGGEEVVTFPKRRNG